MASVAKARRAAQEWSMLVTRRAISKLRRTAAPLTTLAGKRKTPEIMTEHQAELMIQLLYANRGKK
jgi:hypothetical protein